MVNVAAGDEKEALEADAADPALRAGVGVRGQHEPGSAPTEPTSTARPQKARPRDDEDERYRRHQRDLHRAVAHAVDAPRELIEDACQAAWAILVRTQPDRYGIFAWLRVVAIHEAYRLSAGGRRDLHLERLNVDEHDWEELIADPRTLEDAMTALEALRMLASLPERQRSDLTLKIAGYSYDEILALRDGPSATSTRPSGRRRRDH